MYLGVNAYNAYKFLRFVVSKTFSYLFIYFKKDTFSWSKWSVKTQIMLEKFSLHENAVLGKRDPKFWMDV